jgi:hypothetical protein
MGKNLKRRLILLLIVPFVISFAINLLLSIGVRINSSILISIANMLLYLWAFAAVFFWFYVGKQFGDLGVSRTKSFILGNSLWVFSLLLYIWQFILLDGAKRNSFIAVISQYYNLGFVRISSIIIGFFTETIDTKMVTMGSYLIMLIVFAIGFIYTSKNRYLNQSR